MPHPCGYAPKIGRFYLGVILLYSDTPNKAREALFRSSRVNSSSDTENAEIGQFL